MKKDKLDGAKEQQGEQEVLKNIDHSINTAHNLTGVISIESAIYVLNKVSSHAQLSEISHIEMNLDGKYKKVWITNKFLVLLT